MSWTRKDFVGCHKGSSIDWGTRKGVLGAGGPVDAWSQQRTREGG